MNNYKLMIIIKAKYFNIKMMNEIKIKKYNL